MSFCGFDFDNPAYKLARFETLLDVARSKIIQNLESISIHPTVHYRPDGEGTDSAVTSSKDGLYAIASGISLMDCFLRADCYDVRRVTYAEVEGRDNSVSIFGVRSAAEYEANTVVMDNWGYNEDSVGRNAANGAFMLARETGESRSSRGPQLMVDLRSSVDRLGRFAGVDPDWSIKYGNIVLAVSRKLDTCGASTSCIRHGRIYRRLPLSRLGIGIVLDQQPEGATEPLRTLLLSALTPKSPGNGNYTLEHNYENDYDLWPIHTTSVLFHDSEASELLWGCTYFELLASCNNPETIRRRYDPPAAKEKSAGSGRWAMMADRMRNDSDDACIRGGSIRSLLAEQPQD